MNRIVVGVDGSAVSVAALGAATRIAAQRKLDLHVVHGVQLAALAYGGGLAGATGLFEALRFDGERIVAEATGLARSLAPELTVTSEVPVEHPVPLLIELSRSARLIVLGRSGRSGLASVLAGSTVTGVAGHAHCPVLVAGENEDTRETPATGPVVAGVDGSRNSEQALAMAFEEASWRGAPLVAVHAWSDATYDDFYGSARLMVSWESFAEEEERLLAERLAGWPAKYPDVEVCRVLVKDRPRHALLEAADGAQLVVVGSRGRGGFRGLLLGSTSLALVQHANCPVLVVRPEKK